MRFEEKLAAALGLLDSTGMLRGHYAPPLYRLLWKLGIKAPPPHFQSFTTNFVRSGVSFGIVWGLLMWLTVWSRQGKSAYIAFASALSLGVVVGLGAAAHRRYDARKYRIPLWRDFHPADNARI